MSDRHFDELATRFAEKIYGGAKGAIRLAVLQADLAEALPDRPLRVLDVGAGLGHMSLWLAQRGQSFQPKSRGMLGGSRLRELISEMTTRADFVICDSSPVLLIPDNLLLAGAVDGVILVARASSTSFRDLARSKALLEDAGARVLGVVLNRADESVSGGDYYAYYGYYGSPGVEPKRRFFSRLFRRS